MGAVYLVIRTPHSSVWRQGLGLSRALLCPKQVALGQSLDPRSLHSSSGSWAGEFGLPGAEVLQVTTPDRCCAPTGCTYWVRGIVDMSRGSGPYGTDDLVNESLQAGAQTLWGSRPCGARSVSCLAFVPPSRLSLPPKKSLREESRSLTAVPGDGLPPADMAEQLGLCMETIS